MKISDQIKKGVLRCVRSNTPLTQHGNELVSQDGQNRYAMTKAGVPILLKDQAKIDEMLQDNPCMENEYRKPGIYQRARNIFYRDYNSRDFVALAWDFIKNRSSSDLLLSIGGGPVKESDNVTNLNIGTFPNVDIVGDAHDLPYCDEVVDAVFCTAVLEHLRDPVLAVQEMHRVLKKGGRVLSVIPFMQAYHGYPHHYQNFTISGHQYLYEHNGFKIIQYGAPLGPTVALTTLVARYFLEYFPKFLWINVLIGRVVQAIGLLIRPLDRLLEKHPNRHVLASATYVLAEKL